MSEPTLQEAINTLLEDLPAAINRLREAVTQRYASTLKLLVENAETTFESLGDLADGNGLTREQRKLARDIAYHLANVDLTLEDFIATLEVK